MTHPIQSTDEYTRIEACNRGLVWWRRWGPYLAERAWGTVREDYSADGEAWTYFTHDMARSRAYRWNEDGLAGVSDADQHLCLALAVWNERDPFLKERLFGLTGPEGNHGEDAKELYYFTDNTPSHAYMQMRYLYPQVAFPYEDLVRENQQRGKDDPEYELVDALRDSFEAGRYFEITVTYAKAGPEDLICRIDATNCGPEAAPLHLLPHAWFRNTWSWDDNDATRPSLHVDSDTRLRLEHPDLGTRYWMVDAGDGALRLLATENETNTERLYNHPNDTPYVKDGIHAAVVDGQEAAVNPDGTGTKAAAHVQATVEPGATLTVRWRLSDEEIPSPFEDFDAVVDERCEEADAFYAAATPDEVPDAERPIYRQSLAGLLWSKQFYHYRVTRWLEGDPAQPKPNRKKRRNEHWQHLHTKDIVSMPDTWEYPWFAAWDLAFHMIPLTLIDPFWAKGQLLLMLREWYMHPNGQLPAYEWNFSDVNPPVHAWACLQVYRLDAERTGEQDVEFLEKAFHKLLLNFTFWVNQKDAEGNNIFEGGFLGLDNIGVFDRSKPLPVGGRLEQADGTAWMGLYCLTMLSIALELARHRSAYEDVATKFFEHFVYISDAINQTCGGRGLWDEDDGFYYDMMLLPSGEHLPVRIRSLVGLAPVFAVATLDEDLLESLPDFRRRMNWFLEHRPQLTQHIASVTRPGQQGQRLLSLVGRDKLERVLRRMLDPDQFLSPHGLRSMSKEHADNPYTLTFDGTEHRVAYEPGESRSGLFGGNSNWRGPIWMPVNYIMIEALLTYHRYWGDDLMVSYPAPEGSPHTLQEVAHDLADRLTDLFRVGDDGHRPVFGEDSLFASGARWQEHLLFYEYFHGDSGKGLGASHQTGWTSLVANLIHLLATRAS